MLRECCLRAASSARSRARWRAASSALCWRAFMAVTEEHQCLLDRPTPAAARGRTSTRSRRTFVAPEPHQPGREPCAVFRHSAGVLARSARRVATTWKAVRGEFVRATVVATDPDRGGGCYGRIALVLNPRTSPLHPASALGRVLGDRHGHRIAHASQEPSPASRHHRSIVSLTEAPSWLRAPDAARRPAFGNVATGTTKSPASQPARRHRGSSPIRSYPRPTDSAANASVAERNERP
jgi:hypothetical protein